MAGELTKSLTGDSRRWASIFLISSIALFVVGAIFGHVFSLTEGGAGPDWWATIAIGLFGIVFIGTVIQAWVNGSVLLGLIITTAPPTGFALGASERTDLFGFLAHFIIAFYWAGMAGAVGHYLGYEFANHYGTPDLLG